MKKSIFVLILFLVLMFCISSISIKKTNASDSGVDYEVLIDGEEIKGVNIKDPTYGDLSFTNPIDASVYSSAGYVGICYDIEEFNSNSYNCFAFKYDMSNSTGAKAIRIYLEDTNGNIFRAYYGGSLNAPLISEDGTISSWELLYNKKSYSRFTNGICATAIVPINICYTVGSNTQGETPFDNGVAWNTFIGSHPEGITFTKVYFSADVKNNGWYNTDSADRTISIGSMVAYNSSTGAAKELFDAKTLTYSIDPADTTADVNLADPTKGTKVSMGHWFNGNGYYDSDNTINVSDLIACFSLGRNNGGIKVNFVDSESATLQKSVTVSTTYNKATGKFDYEITPDTIKCYQYSSASMALTGSLDEKYAEISLTYAPIPMPEVMATIKDSNDVIIKENVKLLGELNEGTEAFDYEVPELLGYTFVSSDKELTGIKEDTNVILTYAEKDLFKNYDAIYDGDTFKGINIKDSMDNTYKFYAVMNETAVNYGVITLDIDDVDASYYDGIAFQYDRSFTAGQITGRIGLELLDGTIIPLTISSNMIYPDGTVGTFEYSPKTVKLSNKKGTIYLDLTSYGDVTIAKIHYTIYIVTASATGLEKATAFGRFAAVKLGATKEEGLEVKSILDVANLTATNDAEAIADINFAKFGLGTKVYASGYQLLSGDYYIWGTDETVIAAHKDSFKATKTNGKVTVSYVDSDTNQLASDEEFSTVFNPTTMKYEATLQATKVVGYVPLAQEHNVELDSFADVYSIEYKALEAPKVTATIRDYEGNILKDNVQLEGEFISENETFTFKAPDIFKYRFFKSDKELTGITEDTQVVLTYKKNESYDNFDAIYDGETFVGINIKDSMEDTYRFYANKNEAALNYGVITFDFADIDLSYYDGIAFQYDRSFTNNTISARVGLEIEDGTIIPLAWNSTLTLEDGTVEVFEYNNKVVKFSNKSGTVYVDLSSLGDVKLTKLHYGIYIVNDTATGISKATAFGRFVAVKVGPTKEDGIEVRHILNVSGLEATNNPDDLAEINFARFDLGQAVYVSGYQLLSGSYYTWGTDEAVIAAHKSSFKATKAGGKVTVSYVDEKDYEPLLEQVEVDSLFDTATMKYKAEIEIKEIDGYVPLGDVETSVLVDNKEDYVIISYKKVVAPVVTATIKLEDGSTIYTNVELSYKYVDGKFAFSAPKYGKYTFVSSDKDLSDVKEDMSVILTYKEIENIFKEYESVYESTTFKGINITSSMTGAIVVNVSDFYLDDNADNCGYQLTTFEIGELDPTTVSGLLVQMKRTGDEVGMAQVRMYLEDSNGNLYKLFATQISDGPVTYIATNGTFDTVTNNSSAQRVELPANFGGTMFLDLRGLSYPEGVVFTKFHFGRETRYNTAVDKPIAVAKIGTVLIDKNGSETSNGDFVNILADVTKMTYATSAEDENADINLFDMSKGKKVYFNMYLTGTHKKGESADEMDILNDIVKFTKLDPIVNVNFVNAEGEVIMPRAQVSCKEGAYSITPTEIFGYTYDHADSELTGSTDHDIEITLHYVVTPCKITISFMDKDGNKLGDDVIIDALVGDFYQIDSSEYSFEGYKYDSSSSTLSFTVMADKTVVLIYAKESKTNNNPSGGKKKGGLGCKSALGITTITTLSLLAFAGFVLKKKKDNE